jgi:hypothetical protein
MQKEIILYPEAQELQQLGFDDICFGYYRSVLGKPEVELIIRQTPPRFYHLMAIPEHFDVLAPTYSQAFEFFEETYGLFCTINVDQTMEPKFCYSIVEFIVDKDGFFEWETPAPSTYLYYTRGEAELDCLVKLIEIVKERKK